VELGEGRSTPHNGLHGEAPPERGLFQALGIGRVGVPGTEVHVYKTVGKSVICAVILSRYVKGVPFFNGRYTKGIPFLSKMVYKRVRGWTLGWSLPV